MTTDELKTARTDYGLAVGTPRLRSIGPITFSPDGILFVADSANATIYAIDVGDSDPPSQSRPVEVDNLDVRLAAYTACTREDILIRDMAVHPTSMAVYLSVVRGRGSSAMPLLIRIGEDGSVREVSLDGVPFSQVVIENAPADDDERLDTRVVLGDREGEEVEVRGIRLRLARDKLRTSTVTDMAFVDGLLLVAGASNEEFSSTLRRILFPFKKMRPGQTRWRYSTSHTAGTRRLRPFARSCRTATTSASLRVTPAHQSFTSRSTTSSLEPRPRAAPWPIWAR